MVEGWRELPEVRKWGRQVQAAVAQQAGELSWLVGVGGVGTLWIPWCLGAAGCGSCIHGVFLKGEICVILKSSPNTLTTVGPFCIFKRRVVAELRNISGLFVGLGKFRRYPYKSSCVFLFHIRYSLRISFKRLFIKQADQEWEEQERRPMENPLALWCFPRPAKSRTTFDLPRL